MWSCIITSETTKVETHLDSGNSYAIILIVTVNNINSMINNIYVEPFKAIS
jgi:hypothetical protein